MQKLFMCEVVRGFTLGMREGVDPSMWDRTWYSPDRTSCVYKSYYIIISESDPRMKAMSTRDCNMDLNPLQSLQKLQRDSLSLSLFIFFFLLLFLSLLSLTTRCWRGSRGPECCNIES